MNTPHRYQYGSLTRRKRIRTEDVFSRFLRRPVAWTTTANFKPASRLSSPACRTV
jgi:hypothetical protein